MGIGSGEVILVAALALFLLKPEDIPKAMRTLGDWYSQYRRMYHRITQELEDLDRFQWEEKDEKPEAKS